MASRSARVALLYSLLTGASAVENLFARQAVTSFAASQTAACINLAATCFPTVASCTPAFCSACASVGGSDFISCCNGSTAASCIATLLATATTSGASPSGSNDANYNDCNSAFDLISSCASNTIGFTKLDDGDMASCLCYTASSGALGTTTVFAPDVFDKLQSGCVAWASTSDTTDLSDFQAAAGLCTNVGDVRGSSGAATTTGTAATSTGLRSGGTASTRTASATSTPRASSATQSIAPASSSAAAAGMGKAYDDNGKAAWSLGYFLLAFGWLV